MFNNAHAHSSADGSVVATDPLADSTLTTAIAAAQAADDRKADQITVLKVTEVSYLADYFVIATGFSTTQVRAIYQAIAQQVEERTGQLPLRIEGQREGSWVLMDYGDLIVHILLPEEREFYNLEAFWGHAEPVDWSELI